MNKTRINPFTNIKKVTVAILCITGYLFLSMPGCTKQLLEDIHQDKPIAETRSSSDGLFYYYFDKKMAIDQTEDKIFVKFTSDSDKEKIQALINSSSLRIINDTYWDEGIFRFAALKTMDGKHVPLETIEFFKKSPEVVSVEYLIGNNNGSLTGLTDLFMINLKEATSYAQLQEFAEQNNCTVGKEFEFMENHFRIYVSKSSELGVIQTANLFHESGLFEYSCPDFVYMNAFSTNDQYWDEQWGLKNTGQSGGILGVDIKAEQAWAITTGSPNIKIAVIDIGVNLSHDDLQYNLVTGYNAITQTVGGSPHENSATYHHGTLVAGIISALQNNNNKGISGIAPSCKIIPIRAGDVGIATAEIAADAFNWARQNGADVINCSWGGPQNTANAALTTAIANAVTNGRNGKGCVVVFASGNDYASSINYPAFLYNVIAVGAINRNGQRASYSNYGTNLDVVAPGTAIRSTSTSPSGYATGDGTSFAAPHVAGIAALILSVNPDLTQAQVRDAIESTCTNLASLNNQGGRGLVNAYAALGESAISGPNVIGSTACQETFLIGSGISGVSNVSWSVGTGLLIAQNNGINGIKVQRSNGTNHPYDSWVQLTYTVGGQQVTVRKKVLSQIEYSIGIWGDNIGWTVPISSLQNNLSRYATYGIGSIVPSSQDPYLLDISYDVLHSDSYTTIFTWPNNIYENSFEFIQAGTHRVRMKVLDRCGWSNWREEYVQVGW